MNNYPYEAAKDVGLPGFIMAGCSGKGMKRGSGRDSKKV